jgi:hypothetical protein
MASGDRATSKRQHRESHIEKIRSSQILNRMIAHAMGEIEMSATQVAAAKALLDRYLPIVKSVEMEAEVTTRKPATDPIYERPAEVWQQSVGHHSQDHSTH